MLARGRKHRNTLQTTAAAALAGDAMPHRRQPAPLVEETGAGTI